MSSTIEHEQGGGRNIPSAKAGDGLKVGRNIPSAKAGDGLKVGTQNVEGLFRSEGGYHAAVSAVESLMTDRGLHILVLTETKPWRERHWELIEAMKCAGLDWKATETLEEHQRASGAMVVYRKNGGLGCLRAYKDKAGRGVAAHMTTDAGAGFLVVGLYGVTSPDTTQNKLEASLLMGWASDQVAIYRKRVGGEARVLMMGDFNGVEDPNRDRAPLKGGKTRKGGGDDRIINMLAKTGLRDVAELHGDENKTAYNMTFKNIVDKDGNPNGKSRIDRIYVGGGGLQHMVQDSGGAESEIRFGNSHHGLAWAEFSGGFVKPEKKPPAEN